MLKGLWTFVAVTEEIVNVIFEFQYIVRSFDTDSVSPIYSQI